MCFGRECERVFVFPFSSAAMGGACTRGMRHVLKYGENRRTVLLGSLLTRMSDLWGRRGEFIHKFVKKFFFEIELGLLVPQLIL